MRVSNITNTPDAYRQSQFYAGTHLAMYEVASSKQSENKVANSQAFQQKLYEAYSGSHIAKTPSMKEREFLQLREEHINREETFQRLTYQNGVHFTVEQQLTLLKNLK